MWPRHWLDNVGDIPHTDDVHSHKPLDLKTLQCSLLASSWITDRLVWSFGWSKLYRQVTRIPIFPGYLCGSNLVYLSAGWSTGMSRMSHILVLGQWQERVQMFLFYIDLIVRLFADNSVTRYSIIMRFTSKCRFFKLEECGVKIQKLDIFDMWL